MSSSRKSVYFFAVLGVALVVPLTVFLTSASRRSSSSFPHEARVRRGSIDWHFAARGRVEGATSEEIKLAARNVGRIKEVLVSDGDPVKKGQAVAILENNDLKAAVEGARASLAQAQAALEKLMNGARKEERQAAKADMDEALAAADNAHQNLQRAKSLFDEGGIVSRSVLDQDERDEKMAAAKLEAARQRYQLIMAPPRSEDVAAAQAEVALARARLAQAEDTYENTFVRSPVDGVVIKRFMNPGESISYESLYQPIVSVTDTTHMRVRTEVDETDIGKVQLGQRAEVRCEAFPGRTFYGHVMRISGGLGKKKIQTDNPTEKIDLDILESFVELDPGTPLRVGLRVDVYVPLAKKDNVLIIPRRAVEFSDGSALVHLKTAEGVRAQTVRLGAQDGLNIEIAEGVKEGDVVVY